MKRIVLSALVLFCLGSVSYGQGPWGPWPNDGWRGPRRAAGRIVVEGVKRAWEIGKDRIQQAYQERRNEQLRYDAALRREWEANWRAADAERTYPSSWQAERLRQEANQASIERARAELAISLRIQNDKRSLGISTVVPTKQQWIGPNADYSWASPNTQSQSREPRDRDRLSPEAAKAIRSIEKALVEAGERDRREASQTTDKSTNESQEDRRQRWLDNRP